MSAGGNSIDRDGTQDLGGVENLGREGGRSSAGSSAIA